MLNRAAIIFIFIFATNTVFSQWVMQNAGTNYALKSVYFTGSNTGYICGYNLVLKTTNSGVNWINTIVQGNHQSLTFTDNNTGYMCSDSGKIFKTTNAGMNWISQNSNSINNLTSINFLNSQTGIITGYGKTLLKTTNGGNNWFNIANIIWEVDFLSSKIINAENYYVTGTESFIIRTTNGGANWIIYTHGEPNPIFTVDFLDENTGFATGCCGMFMATTNAGANWAENFYLSLGFTFRSLKFADANTGFCAGDNGMIYRSTNRGVNWDSTVTGTNEILYSLFMLNNDTGWAVGGYGTILKTTNGGGVGFSIGIEPVSNEVPKDFKLFQNYPNPFNPSTKIRFTTPLSPPEGGKLLKLSVYDVLGKEVQILVNEELSPGSYEVNFDALGLPSGIYYYILSVNGYRESRKMVLVK